MRKNFWENFVFFAKIGKHCPNFFETWVPAVSAPVVPLLERYFFSWFNLSTAIVPNLEPITRPLGSEVGLGFELLQNIF